MAEISWVIWTSRLSPFGLKVILLCRHAGLSYKVLPGAGNFIEDWRYHLRRARLVAGKLPLTAPKMEPEDEYPLVPFLFGPQGENLYDSTAIAVWLDQKLPAGQRVIPDDPAAAFVVRLIDDYLDEFGLYMVHHNRWKLSAADNTAGKLVAHEYRSIYGPLEFITAKVFSKRQTRRMPYLFSVAPDSLPGFPPTHDLLESCWFRLIDILETLLTERPFVLGERFTLADAAIYGQLAMNLEIDPTAEAMLKARGPKLHAWLWRLHRGDVSASQPGADLQINAALKPLLAEICRIHVPLMQQNLAAYEDWRAKGQTRFNEAAFDRREALYDGELDGQPFRHVAKSFQAKVWRQSVAAWNALASDELQALLPPGHGIDVERHGHMQAGG